MRNSPPTDRFWEVEERINSEKRILRNCLGKHSRSNMFFSMAIMYRHEMVTDEDLKGFSDELIEQLRVVGEI